MEDIILSLLNILGSLVKQQLISCAEVYFYVLASVPLVYVSIFTKYNSVWITCFFLKFKVASFIFIAFQNGLKSGSVMPRDLFFSLKIALANHGLFFFFHKYFRIIFFFISLKNSIEILIGIALNMYIALGNWTCLSFFDTLTWGLFPFVCVSFSFMFVCF